MLSGRSGIVDSSRNRWSSLISPVHETASFTARMNISRHLIVWIKTQGMTAYSRCCMPIVAVISRGEPFLRVVTYRATEFISSKARIFVAGSRSEWFVKSSDRLLPQGKTCSISAQQNVDGSGGFKQAPIALVVGHYLVLSKTPRSSWGIWTTLLLTYLIRLLWFAGTTMYTFNF